MGFLCFCLGNFMVLDGFRLYEPGLGLSLLPPIFFRFFGGAVLVALAAMVYTPVICEKLAWSFERFLFPKPEVQQVASLGIAQALVMKRDYDGALRELESKMEQFPDQKNLLTLYYQIKYEKYEVSEEVLAAIRREIFSQPWDPEYEKLVSIAMDIYLENMEVDALQSFLKLAMEHCRDESASARMAMRLQSFQDFENSDHG